MILDVEARGITLGVHFPVNPPILPMLAKRVAEMPTGGGWLFEPKWGGFRALVFRDGEDILLQSRDEKPLNRYFPTSCSSRYSRSCLAAVCSTAKSSSSRMLGWTSMRYSSAYIRPHRG